MSDIINLTLSALINKIKKKELSSREITNAYITRAEKSKNLNTYITTDFENAIEKAKKFDEKGNFDAGEANEEISEKKKEENLNNIVKELF